MNFVAIDFETANRYRSSACSVAVVAVEDGQITRTFYSLIQPPVMQFDYWNTKIHGITAADVADQPTFAELWQDIKPYLENKIVLAHNAAFDMSVLRSVLGEYSIPVPDFNHACTVELAKKVWPQELSYKLSALADRFDISFEHHHALHDARTCAQLALLAAQSLKADNFLNLAELAQLKIRAFRRETGSYIATKDCKKVI